MRLAHFSLLIACLGGPGFSPALGQETGRAPAALIGTFGNSPQQCRSYHRKHDDMKTISKDSYTFCGGSGCEARIVGSRKTATGYRLRLVSTLSESAWAADFREISPDVFETRVEGDKRVETIVRCTRKDIEAGVGLSSDPTGLTQAMSAAFSVYYARAVPALCANTKVNEGEADALAVIAARTWAAFLRERNIASPAAGGVEADMMRERKAANYAASADAKELPSFCRDAMRAFGPGGRVYPDLLSDPRRGA